MKIKTKEKKCQIIIFVGSQYLGHKPDDGETMKNLVLSNAFERLGLRVIKIDVRNRWQRPLYLAKYLLALLFVRNAKLVFSASSFVTYPLLRIAKLLGWKGANIYYWVIGGNYANYVEEGSISSKLYFDLRKIIVEGESMKVKLEGMGYSNVIVLPNIKDIEYIPIKESSNTAMKRFVFLSRVMPQKGVDYIIEASTKLNAMGYKNFIVDIYGRVDPGYEQEFKKKIQGIDNVEYKGFLNLDTNEGYDTLASYDVMLFPTYWVGEGFPGIIIDAFVAGLPIIATDWNLNKSLIHDGYNGIIIPVHDVDALASAMKSVVNGKVSITELAENSRKSSSLYDAKNVISSELLNKIGMYE